MYLNKTFIIGNLTRDPELRALPSGAKVVQFSIATNRVYKDTQGAKKEEVEYHNIVVFGMQGENCAKYLKKGQSALIEGRIQTKSWDDKETGDKKYKTEIVAESVQFGPRAGGVANKQVEDDGSVDSEEVVGSGLDLDDIPF